MADSKPLKAVITAGGIGTRLLPFSKEIPKEMAPILVNGENGSIQVKPMVQAIYEQLYDWGIRDFIFIVARGKGAIQNHFTSDPSFVEQLGKRGKNLGALREFYRKLHSSNVIFIPQPEALGFGDAVLRARPHINSDFLVHAGDTYIISNGGDHLKRLQEAHSAYAASATVLVQKVRNPEQYGVVKGEDLEAGTMRIEEAVEKPSKPESTIAMMPVYMFQNSVFQYLADLDAGKDGEIQLTDAIRSMIKAGKKVIGVNMMREEIRLEIGSPETLLEALKLSEEQLKR